MQLALEWMALGCAQGERPRVGRVLFGPGGELHEVQHEGGLHPRLLERVVGTRINRSQGGSSQRTDNDRTQAGVAGVGD